MNGMYFSLNFLFQYIWFLHIYIDGLSGEKNNYQ